MNLHGRRISCAGRKSERWYKWQEPNERQTRSFRRRKLPHRRRSNTVPPPMPAFPWKTAANPARIPLRGRKISCSGSSKMTRRSPCTGCSVITGRLERISNGLNLKSSWRRSSAERLTASWSKTYPVLAETTRRPAIIWSAFFLFWACASSPSTMDLIPSPPSGARTVIWCR